MNTDAPRLDGNAVLRFAPHARFRFDEVRQAWVVLAPERLLLPDEQAVEILRLIDGERAVDAIIEKHRTPALHSRAHAANGQEWLRITSNDACILMIGFKNGRLTSAALRDEDSVDTPCSGAPPDLE